MSEAYFKIVPVRTKGSSGYTMRIVEIDPNETPSSKRRRKTKMEKRRIRRRLEKQK